MTDELGFKSKLALRLLLAGALAAVAGEYTLAVFDLNRKSYGEGPILALVERMRTEPVSASWRQGPCYTLSCYGPAYYLAFDWAARIGGWRRSIIPGRLVSLGAALVAAALACAMVARQTRSIELGLLGALIFLASPTVSYWMPYARVDMPALALAAGAYFTAGQDRSRIRKNSGATRDGGRPRRAGASYRNTNNPSWWAGASAALVVAASLVKPTMALSALPIAAHLAVNRRLRDALVFVATVVLLGTAAWAAAETISRGFFLTAVLAGNQNRMIPWRGYAYGYAFLTSPLGTAAAISSACLLIAEPGRTLRSLVGLGFLVSFTISVVIVCKQGSDHNYFLEPALWGSMLAAGWGAPRLIAIHPRRAAACVAVLSLAVALPSLRAIKVAAGQSRGTPQAYAAVTSWLRQEPRDAGVLADGECVDLVLSAGHVPLVNDSYLFTLLVANGTLAPDGVLEAIEQGRIRWLLLDHSIDNHREAIGRNAQMWPSEVIESMRRHYELVARQGEVFVYRWKLFPKVRSAL